MKSVVLFLLALLTAFSASAQTGMPHVSGRVLDRLSHEAIAGATVSLKLTTDGSEHRQTTKADGSFRFTLPTISSDIFVHAVGYVSAHIPVSGSRDSLLILLDRDQSENGQLVVTALRHTAMAQEIPVSTVVARNSEIQSHNPQGLDNALRYIPGVTLSEDQLSIRGSTGYSRSVGARVLLLLDGMPFLSADNSDMKFDAVPLLSVDRVEVVKGAGSALYGSSALGGVINIITKEPSEEFRTAFNAYSGVYDAPTYPEWKVPGLKRRFISVEGGTSGGIGVSRLLVSGAYKRNEGYRLGDDNFRWNAFGKLEQPISTAHKLTISTLFANEDHGGWLYWRSLSTPYLPYDSLEAVNARIHSFKSNIAGTVNSFWSDNVSSSLKINNFHTNFTTDPKSVGDTTGSHSSANSLNFDLSGTWIAENWAVVTAGLTSSLQSVTSNLFLNRSGTMLGAFAQLEYRPITGLTLTPGIRWDGITYDSVSEENQFSPKFGVAYSVLRDPDQELTLRGSYGSGFRAPSIGERFIQSTLSGFQVHPNLALSPETSTSFEMGASYRLDEVTLDIAGFTSRFKDLIEPHFVNDLNAGTSYIQFSNVTEARVSGHEENLTFRPFNGGFTLQAGYTYIYPEDLASHQILQFRSRHLLQLSAETQVRGVKLGGDFRYISHYETMDSLLSLRVPDGSAITDIRVADARVGYDLKGVGLPLALTFQVQNIFNYYYVEIAGNMAPPRSYSLRLEANF